MRRGVLFFTLLLALGAFLASCGKEESSSGADACHNSLHIIASIPSTKTYISGIRDNCYSLSWAVGDKLGVFQTSSGTTSDIVESEPLGENSPEASFNVNLPYEVSGSVITAVYPVSAISGGSGKSSILTFPTSQNCIGGSFDSSADLMVSAAANPVDGTVCLPLRRLGATIRIDLASVPSGVTVQSLTVASRDSRLVGSYTFNRISGETEITAKGDSKAVLTSDNSTYYARVLTGTHHGLVFSFLTDKGCYRKEYDQTLYLTEGSVSHYSVSLKEKDLSLPGLGLASDPYLIMTIEDLKKVESLLVATETVYFKVGQDIDFSSCENWEPVCNSEIPYNMVFDGDGHKFSNLHCSQTNNASVFGIVSGTVKNLVIENCSAETTGKSDGTHAAMLVAYVPGNLNCTNVTIKSCQLRAGLAGGSAVGSSPSLYRYMGGIAGMVKGKLTLTDCSFFGTIEADGKLCGGLVGQVSGVGTYLRCTADGSISGGEFIAGMCSYQQSAESTFTDCTCTMDITATGGYNGGFLAMNGNGGSHPSATFVRCTYGEKNKPSSFNAKFNSGGLVGQGKNGIVKATDCNVYSEMTVTDEICGGICGISRAGSKITSCTFEGSLNKAKYMGGIVGYAEGQIEVRSCSVSSTMTTTADYSGGIIGIVTGSNSLIEGSRFTGEINGGTSATYTGGIVGSVSASGTKISACSFSGTIQVSSRGGGILSSDDSGSTTIVNCYSEGEIHIGNAGATDRLMAGGIVSDVKSNSEISNCYSCVKLYGGYCLGGIVGRATNKTSDYSTAYGIKISRCIFGGDVFDSKYNIPSGKHSSGYIAGLTSGKNLNEDCYRLSDNNMKVWNTGASNFNTPYDQKNSSPSAVLYLKHSASHYSPYHGVYSTSTASSLAKSLGWSESVWDLSSNTPKLK